MILTIFLNNTAHEKGVSSVDQSKTVITLDKLLSKRIPMTAMVVRSWRLCYWYIPYEYNKDLTSILGMVKNIEVNDQAIDRGTIQVILK